MSNSKDEEESYWNDPASELVNIHEGVVSPKESAIDSEEQKEVSETTDGLNGFENSPGMVLSLHESMDVDSEMPETVAESWAGSMDDIGTDPSDLQSHTCDQDNTTVERQDNIYVEHTPREHIQRSKDNWRPRWGQVYHNRWSQRGSRDRYSRSRGFRNRDFTSWQGHKRSAPQGGENSGDCLTCGRRHFGPCWKTMTCDYCQRKGHPSDRCHYRNQYKRFTKGTLDDKA